MLLRDVQFATVTGELVVTTSVITLTHVRLRILNNKTALCGPFTLHSHSTTREPYLLYWSAGLRGEDSCCLTAAPCVVSPCVVSLLLLWLLQLTEVNRFDLTSVHTLHCTLTTCYQWFYCSYRVLRQWHKNCQITKLLYWTVPVWWVLLHMMYNYTTHSMLISL